MNKGIQYTHLCNNYENVYFAFKEVQVKIAIYGVFCPRILFIFANNDDSDDMDLHSLPKYLFTSAQKEKG